MTNRKLVCWPGDLLQVCILHEIRIIRVEKFLFSINELLKREHAHICDPHLNLDETGLK